MNYAKKTCIAVIALLSALLLHVSSLQAATISQVPAQLPLFLNKAVPPLNMLVVGRDHKLFFPAYNDASDIDGDGSIDIRYKPSIDYLGYFDSYKCYSYNGSYFTAASTTADKTCGGSAWSGDYLNYLTTSRADALRKVLYGGYRYVDTATQTILARAYISTDAHTWGKEYNSILVDGYDLRKYTPLPLPDSGNYTLFANNSQGTVESVNPPLLRVLSNIANVRIFGWVSRESVQGGTTATTTSFKDITVTPQDFAVRVQVCKTGFLETNCKLYPNGQYKPTGILHDYGEGNQMYFGLMTGTYTNNTQGGALRKGIGSFASEIDPSTGIFGTQNAAGAYIKGGIIGTLDGLKLTSTGCSSLTFMNNGSCPNWGNPLAEMMFETMRYFSGITNPTTGYLSGAADTLLGLSGLSTWSNPYSTAPNANTTPPTYPSCSRPFETLFSDVNPNYDSDLPGSSFAISGPPDTAPLLSNFNATTLGNVIWNKDVGGSQSINIGEVLTLNDNAPTAKTASSFGQIRGLPEEPTKQGSFYSAAVAYFANTNPITSLGNQRVQTFSIALSSTLPRIQIPMGNNNTITLVPFGKVTNNGVTEQLSGFYIDSLYNMPGQPQNANINGGRAQAIFRVVYDDCGQGCDYDMDAIVLYTVAVNAAGTLDVTLQTVYSVAGNESHMGYTISGTTHDGVYLEVTGGGNGNVHYALDTPGTQLPGSCPCTGNNTLLPGMKNNSVVVNGGATHTRNFTASANTSVTNLKDPLWYAAKWGGFGDSSNTSSSQPVDGQWDSNIKGTPNNYFLVTNASLLKTQLANAFNQILQTNSSVSAPAVSPTTSTGNANEVYSNTMSVTYWSGELTKRTLTSTAVGNTLSTTTAVNWLASQHMPTWSQRNITMANSAPMTTGAKLQPFTYSNQLSVFPTSKLTSTQVDFLRGDTTNEISTFRKRASLLGDIVNSAPVVVSTATFIPSIADNLNGSPGDYATFKATQATRRSQVYVGANDGMLHGFDSATGVEKFAFIPSAVVPNLGALTARTYNTDPSLHQYFVDATPVVSDVYINNAWRTVLVGTLGGGGREIFALDITNPDSISLLWEFTSQNDPDLGYTFSIPVISRLHTGGWGVIVGNGYSGNKGNASLFVFDIASGTVLSKLNAASNNNGLSSPAVLDFDSDGIADYVYAGDLMGNLWRFDLQSSTASNFSVSFSGKPLYQATVSDTANSAVQSITAAPIVAQHPSNTGTIVIFGTGRYFATADKSNTDLQTLYGIWDQNTKGLSPSQTPLLNRSTLQAQTINVQNNAATFGSSSSAIRIVSNSPVDWSSKSGWYLDFVTGNSLVGERMVDPLQTLGDVLFVSTRTPSTDICTPGINGWTYALDPTTGGRTAFTVFNLSRTGTINGTDNYNGTVVSGISTPSIGGTITGGGVNGNGTFFSGSDALTTALGPYHNGRQTWRVVPTN